MKVQIQINRWHIEEGIRHSCSRCPVALAMSSVSLLGYSVLVHRDFIIIRQMQKVGIAVLPILPHVKEFIQDFDHGRFMRPMVMEFDMPEYVARVFLR